MTKEIRPGDIAEAEKQQLGRVNLDTGWADYSRLEEVTIGDRAVPRVIYVTYPPIEGNPGLSMTIDSSSGVPRCTDLRITADPDGREVRTSDVRAVAVADWVELIVSAASAPIGWSDEGARFVSRPSEADRMRAVRAIREARRSTRRRVTPELLQRVAKVYRENDERPVEAVEAAFGTSYRTAARYVQLARRDGYLPEREG